MFVLKAFWDMNIICFMLCNAISRSWVRMPTNVYKEAFINVLFFNINTSVTAG